MFSVYKSDDNFVQSFTLQEVVDDAVVSFVHYLPFPMNFSQSA